MLQHLGIERCLGRCPDNRSPNLANMPARLQMTMTADRCDPLWALAQSRARHSRISQEAALGKHSRLPWFLNIGRSQTEKAKSTNSDLPPLGSVEAGRVVS